MHLARIFSLALVSSLAACAASTSPDDADSTAAALQNADQAGLDVQVLQVWNAGHAWPSDTLSQYQASYFPHGADDVALGAMSGRCPVTNHLVNGDYTNDTLDCSGSFNAALAFPGAAPSPNVDPIAWTRESYASTNGTQTESDPDFCPVIEVRVLLRDEALNAPTFAGVGFFTTRGNTFATKAQLHVVGHSTLKNGDAASVLRFTGIYNCISGAHMSTSGAEYQTFGFKPYARYDVPNSADQYRVWEAIQDNHWIGRSWPGSKPAVDSTGFDRQDDLLKK